MINKKVKRYATANHAAYNAVIWAKEQLRDLYVEPYWFESLFEDIDKWKDLRTFFRDIFRNILDSKVPYRYKFSIIAVLVSGKFHPDGSFQLPPTFVVMKNYPAVVRSIFGNGNVLYITAANDQWQDDREVSVPLTLKTPPIYW